MHVKASTMNSDDLARALIAGINHHSLGWGEEAAVLFLIAQGTWLHRAEFRAHVAVESAQPGGTTAWIIWDQLAAEPDATPASSGERAVLRLACHLGGELPEKPNRDWTLNAILNRLDIDTCLLATRAITMAALGSDAVGPLT